MQEKLHICILMIFTSLIIFSDQYLAYQNRNLSEIHYDYFWYNTLILYTSSFILAIIVTWMYDLKAAVATFLINVLYLDFLLILKVSNKKSNRFCFTQMIIRFFPLMIMHLYYNQYKGLLLCSQINAFQQNIMFFNQISFALIFLLHFQFLTDSENFFHIEMSLKDLLMKIYQVSNALSFYGICQTISFYAYLLKDGQKLVYFYIILIIVEIMVNHYLYIKLKRMKVTWGSFDIFRYTQNLIFSIRSISSSRVALKVLFTNTKICFFRIILTSIILYFRNDLQLQEIQQQTKDGTKKVDKVVFYLNFYLFLNIYLIIFHSGKCINLYKQINYCYDQVSEERIEYHLNQIPFKQYTHMMNIFVKNNSPQLDAEGSYYFKSSYSQILYFKALNQTFRAVKNKQKQVVIDNLIMFSFYKQSAKLKKSLEFQFLMTLEYLDPVFLKHNYTYDECKQIIFQRYQNFGIFSDEAIQIINKILNYNSNLKYLNLQIYQIVAYYKIIASQTANHQGQILFDLYEI
ncbi:hypothetical protein ABPG74_000804 [Tetrahymena malaccensis]